LFGGKSLVKREAPEMFFEKFRKVKDSLGSCCSGVKRYLLTRHVFDTTEGKARPGGCEVFCDLSDKTTFFAWQRNHMANERTFLSWCRTGIALIAFGFVIERFDILIREINFFASRPDIAQHLHGTRFIGITTFALGALIIVLAGWRFFYIRKLINQGDTEFSILPDMFLMGSCLLPSAPRSYSSPSSSDSVPLDEHISFVAGNPAAAGEGMSPSADQRSPACTADAIPPDGTALT